MQRNTQEMKQTIKLIRGYCNLWLHYVNTSGEDSYTDKIIDNIGILQNSLDRLYRSQGDTPGEVEDIAEWMANKRLDV